MDKAIYFDMDGTIANLYGVENWLPKLIAHDETPYTEAKPLLHLATLARILNRLQKQGYQLGIVSWLAKNPNPAYDEKVTLAKLHWLATHLKSIEWNEIHIVPYGTPKSTVVKLPKGILFDDEAPNRKEWQGEAFDVNNIIETLKGLE